jgi:hypothetical protein
MYVLLTFHLLGLADVFADVVVPLPLPLSAILILVIGACTD